jgi:peptide/nickel transport system permease protein
MGVFLIVVFAVQLGWFPVISQVPGTNPVDWFRQLLLPALPLMFVLFGYVSRMARAGTVAARAGSLAVYVCSATAAARAGTLVAACAAGAAMSAPAIAMAGAALYAVPATCCTCDGLVCLPAATGHDLPTLEAAVLLIALVYTVANLLADVLYAVLNPRVRLAST